MTALYIILAIAAVIALIIFIPIDAAFSVAYIEKNTDIKLAVSYFPVKIKILPPKKKKQDDKPTEEEKKEDKKKKKPKEKQPISKTIEFAKAVLDETLDDILRLIRHLFSHTLMVKQFFISAKIGTGDPMYTGIAYGAANAFIYKLLGFIDRHTKLDKWNVALDTDFDSFVIDASADLVIRTRIAYILKLGFMAALILFKIYRINRRIKKNG